MEKQSGWQVIVVDWDIGKYASVDPQTDDDDWDQEIAAEKEKGRDIHWFHHDAEDTSGLQRWAEQHELKQTDVSDLMPASRLRR